MDTNKLNNPSDLAQYIDHTQLRPEATEEQILQLCEEAKQYNFKSVCIERQWLPVVVPKLKGSSVLACTVVSFPEGTDPAQTKAEQTAHAVEMGAQEVDMVLDRSYLKEGNLDGLLNDISSVVNAAGTATVKVILETCQLSNDEIVQACEVSKKAGAHFVKTSTGFSTGGATTQHIALMRKTVGPDMGVKASGGIRTLADAKAMIEAGASRLGMSASVAVMKELQG